MKYSKKRNIAIAAVCVVAFSAFTVNTIIKDVRKKIFTTYLMDEYYKPDRYDSKIHPDTTITFGPSIDKQGKTVLTKGLYGLPNAWQYANALDDKNNYDSPEFNKNFTNAFGASLHGKTITMANEYDGKKEQFVGFSGNGLLAAFNKLYIKPTDDFEGYKMKTIYKFACKDYVRDLTKLMAHLMTKKTLFTQLSNDYLNKAKTTKDFHPQIVLDGYINKLLPGKEREKFKDFEETVSTNTIGALMRRQMDGSLPTLLNCLKTVLKDYDPEALKFINGTF
jgi:hypothetical protein